MSENSKEIKKKHYVNAHVFRDQIREYYETDIMTDILAENLMKIAEGLSYHQSFIRYTPSWKSEMRGDAVLKMYQALEKKLYKVDAEFSPFAYFNRIAWNAFANRIKKENAQHNGLKDYKDMVYSEHMNDPNSMGHVYVRPHMEGDEYDDND